MGYLSKTICWPTNAEALDAYYSDVPPYQTVVSGATTENLYTLQGSVWNMSQYGITSAGVRSLKYTVPAPVINFPTCTVVDDPTTQFADGMELGWGVGLAMIAAWGLSYLAKRQLGTRL